MPRTSYHHRGAPGAIPKLSVTIRIGLQLSWFRLISLPRRKVNGLTIFFFFFLFLRSALRTALTRVTMGTADILFCFCNSVDKNNKPD